MNDIAISLLDAAVTAKQKHDQLEAKMSGYPGIDDCTHPPLTKAGRRNRRTFCHTCYHQYTEHQHQSEEIEYQWAGAWSFLEKAGVL